LDAAYLSKSLIIRGLQCHKSLYLHKYHPELKDEIPPSREAVFESGAEVGILARGLFPGGINIPYEKDSIEKQAELTKDAIEKGITTIYEASFYYDGVFVKIDILRKGKRGWEIYEVKSSTSLKDIYIPDAAVQYYVAAGAGLEISGVFLIHINNQYIRKGEIELEKLFTVNDVTYEVVRVQDAIEGEIVAQKVMLKGGIPKTDIGLYCREPYDCDFIGHCWRHIPDGSVFEIKGSRAFSFTLYKNGILYMKDVPVYMLTPNQRMQAKAAVEKKRFISKELIRGFIDSLWYPQCFLDFETFGSPVPPFSGTRPYQQIPFQYSLHIIEKEGSKPVHSEYLAYPGADPRRELASKLLSEIPEGACVIAYVASFEKGVLNDLAEYFPEFRSRIRIITEYIIDLALPFQKRYIYDWRFKGSYSLKAVLPALVPELSYEGMEINNGGMAMQAYEKMKTEDDPLVIEKIRSALLEYCSLDTLAMVRIVNVLQEMI
jgi:hypothetical protein